jgi:hypothetical protein
MLIVKIVIMHVILIIFYILSCRYNVSFHVSCRVVDNIFRDSLLCFIFESKYRILV